MHGLIQKRIPIGHVNVSSRFVILPVGNAVANSETLKFGLEGSYLIDKLAKEIP